MGTAPTSGPSSVPLSVPCPPRSLERPYLPTCLSVTSSLRCTPTLATGPGAQVPPCPNTTGLEAPTHTLMTLRANF